MACTQLEQALDRVVPPRAHLTPETRDAIEAAIAAVFGADVAAAVAAIAGIVAPGDGTVAFPWLGMRLASPVASRAPRDRRPWPAHASGAATLLAAAMAVAGARDRTRDRAGAPVSSSVPDMARAAVAALGTDFFDIPEGIESAVAADITAAMAAAAAMSAELAAQAELADPAASQPGRATMAVLISVIADDTGMVSYMPAGETARLGRSLAASAARASAEGAIGDDELAAAAAIAVIAAVFRSDCNYGHKIRADDMTTCDEDPMLARAGVAAAFDSL